MTACHRLGAVKPRWAWGTAKPSQGSQAFPRMRIQIRLRLMRENDSGCVNPELSGGLFFLAIWPKICYYTLVNADIRLLRAKGLASARQLLCNRRWTPLLAARHGCRTLACVGRMLVLLPQAIQRTSSIPKMTYGCNSGGVTLARWGFRRDVAGLVSVPALLPNG